MKLTFCIIAGSKYYKLQFNKRWFKYGKDNRRNWFCAIGDEAGTKRAFHTSSFLKSAFKSVNLLLNIK